MSTLHEAFEEALHELAVQASFVADEEGRIATTPDVAEANLGVLAAKIVAFRKARRALFAESPPAPAATRKPTNELQLAAGASHPSDQEQEGLRTVNQTTIETAATIADPGAPTTEQRAESDLYDAWEAADDAWREQFHPAIVTAGPTWAVDVSTETIRYDVEGTMLPKPYIRVIISSRDYLGKKLGTGSIVQNADYDPEDGTLTLDGDPYIDLYIPDGRAWTVNDLDQLAASLQDLSDAANKLGLPSGLDAEQARMVTS